MILKENRLPLLNRADNPEADQESSNLGTNVGTASSQSGDASGLSGDVSSGVTKTDSMRDVFVKFNTMFLKKFDSLDSTLQKLDKRFDKQEQKDKDSNVEKGLSDLNKNISSLMKMDKDETGTGLMSFFSNLITNNPALSSIAAALTAGLVIKSIFGIETWEDAGRALNSVMTAGETNESTRNPESDAGLNWLLDKTNRAYLPKPGGPGVDVKDGKIHVSGNNNAEKAMDYFQKKGYNKIESAGIVGNLQGESDEDIKPKAVGDQGLAFGSAQWHPDRQRKFKELFKHDIRESTFMEQLAFIDWELNNTHKDARESLRNAKTVNEATIAVMRKYEKPKDGSSLEARKGFAVNAYNRSIAADQKAAEERKNHPILKKDPDSPKEAMDWGKLIKDMFGGGGPSINQEQVQGPLSYNKLQEQIKKEDERKLLDEGTAYAMNQPQVMQPVVTNIDNTSTTFITKIDPTPKDESYHRGVSLSGSYDAFRV